MNGYATGYDLGRMIGGLLVIALMISVIAWYRLPPEQHTLWKFVEWFFGAVVALLIIGFIFFGIGRMIGTV